MTDPNLWLPIQDRVTLAALSKLIEECGELASAAARCIAQGVDKREPVTGKLNRDWLAEELADVMALCQLVEQVTETPIDSKRVLDKYAMKHKWLKMIDDFENWGRVR